MKKMEPIKAGIVPVWGKVLMVGSITIGKGIERGYYYASPWNQFWKLLDSVLDLEGENENFLLLKNQLNANFTNYKKNIYINTVDFEKEKNRIKGDIEKLLIKNNIGICDIFKSCWFKKDDSTDDSDIILKDEKYSPEYYDKEIIAKIESGEVQTIVVNSKFVEEIVLERLGENYSKKIIRVISPSAMCRKFSLTEKKSDWNNKLKGIINGN